VKSLIVWLFIFLVIVDMCLGADLAVFEKVIICCWVKGMVSYVLYLISQWIRNMKSGRLTDMKSI
jgi:hypothetical protein